MSGPILFKLSLKLFVTIRESKECIKYYYPSFFYLALGILVDCIPFKHCISTCSMHGLLV